MNMGQLLANMLEDLQRTMDADDGPGIPALTTEEAAAIVRDERRLELEAAQANGIDRCVIDVYQPHCMGTLRFHGDSGHLHGLLWAENSPGQWAAFPFAAKLQPGDAKGLMARLRELGSPYHNPAEGGITQYPKGGSGRPVRDDAGNPGGK